VRRGRRSFGWFEASPKKPPPTHGIKVRSVGTTWWGERWIRALEEILRGGAARLARGRTYARAGRVHDLEIKAGQVTASVTGSRPKPYAVRIAIAELSGAAWKRAIAAMADKAAFSAALLAGEMPKDIEEAFRGAGARLFPVEHRDLATNCSCPDWGDPCKHVAAVHYVLGEAFDRDPFLLFELRGRTRDAVLDALRAARVGEAAEAAEEAHPHESVAAERAVAIERAAAIERAVAMERAVASERAAAEVARSRQGVAIERRAAIDRARRADRPARRREARRLRRAPRRAPCAALPLRRARHARRSAPPARRARRVGRGREPRRRARTAGPRRCRACAAHRDLRAERRRRAGCGGCARGRTAPPRVRAPRRPVRSRARRSRAAATASPRGETVVGGLGSAPTVKRGGREPSAHDLPATVAMPYLPPREVADEW
jgi:uncharacterized Zn finger protein